MELTAADIKPTRAVNLRPASNHSNAPEEYQAMIRSKSLSDRREGGVSKIRSAEHEDNQSASSLSRKQVPQQPQQIMHNAQISVQHSAPRPETRMETDDSYVSKGYVSATHSRHNTMGQDFDMDFGSDLIEDYNGV